MGKDNNANCYKNAICVSVGLLIVFTTSIFVAKDYFGLKIATLIDEASLLKDYRYSDWGRHPSRKGDAEYNYNLTLYDMTAGQSNAKMQNVVLEHSFAYRDISFGQGNQGFIKYLDEWDLKATADLPTLPISTLNLPAQKVYAYERLAPAARRFAILFNNLWRTVEDQLLPFFAAQLHGFYFQNQQTVNDAVFGEIGLSNDLMKAIYEHQTYGWGRKETFQHWVRLAHFKNRKELKEYEIIQQALSISAADMDRLVGEHSMLNTLSAALNGTIRLILQNPRTYAYGKCVPYCSNTQLIAFQLLTGSLTASPVFVNVNLKASLKELNNTLLGDVEYNKFCPDSFACPLDENTLDFFTSAHLGNFTTLGKVFANIDNLEIVQGLFQLPDTTYAQNILAYMKYLQENVFNPTNPITQTVDTKAYEYMLNNHIYINTAINDIKYILNVELHSRAFFQLVTKDDAKCEDFFTNDYKAFVQLCQKKQFDLSKIEAVRTYVKAFFFYDRAAFVKATGMTVTQARQFLRLDQQSLFVAKMNAVRVALSGSLGCQGTYCTEEELLVREWSGENDVLSHLPTELFPTPLTIIDLDVDNRLNGVQPQLHKITGQKLSTQNGKLLLGNGPESILVLYNLLAMKTQCDTGDQNAKKKINYVQKVAIDVYFGGPTPKKSTADIISGFEAAGIRVKQAADELLGGAKWLPSSVQMMETRHRPTAYSKLNTGIYDRNKLRGMLEVEQSAFLGSHLTLFLNQYEEVTQFLSSERKVYGTNLLGFHPDISPSQTLSVLLHFAYQTATLSPQETVTINNVDGIKYNVKVDAPKAFIGYNEQNERSVTISPDSYFIIDQITGNTLQFLVKYSVSSPASFLAYYPSASTAERTLFDCQVYYSREDVQAITAISTQKASLRLVYIITIVLASVSMIWIVVLAVLYKVKRNTRGRQLNDTLISSEAGSSIKI